MSRRERSERDDEIKGQGIDILEAVLRSDIAAITIQAFIRGFVCRAIQRRRALARASAVDSGKFGDHDVSAVIDDGKQNDIDYW